MKVIVIVLIVLLVLGFIGVKYHYIKQKQDPSFFIKQEKPLSTQEKVENSLEDIRNKLGFENK